MQHPNQGERILPWATNATKEINSQKLTGGNGILVKKSPYGTSIGIKKSAEPHPDSVPTNAAELSSMSQEGFATTYSLQRDQQNSFSLFQFGNLSAVEDYTLSSLLSTDFVFRDRCSEKHSIDKSPTVRYDNVYNLLSTAMFGKKVEISGDNALSVYPLSDYLSGLSGDIPVIGGFSWGLNNEYGSLCAQIDHWHFDHGRLQSIFSNVSSITLFRAVAEQV